MEPAPLYVCVCVLCASVSFRGARNEEVKSFYSFPQQTGFISVNISALLAGASLSVRAMNGSLHRPELSLNFTN